MTSHSTAFKSALLASAGLTLFAATAGAVSPPVVITEPSLFASCSNSAPPTAVSYLSAEVEPWVAVNPANSNNLIAGWQQDRWSDGGAKSNMSAYSMDGGATWTTVVVPGINTCTGGVAPLDMDRSTDPWVDFSSDGSVAYFMSLSFDNDIAPGVSGANAMLVNRSFDGGATWEEPPYTLILSDNGNDFNDKNALTADPNDPDVAYAVWDRLANVAGKHDGANDANGRRRTAIDRGGTSENSAFAYIGPTLFTRTTNGGDSWSEPVIIHNPGVTAQTIGNQIVVQPTSAGGDVFNFYTQIDHNGQTSLGFVRSTDQGATWSAGVTALKTQLTRNGTITPDNKATVRDGNILFDVAVDPVNGNLYLAWQDARNQNIDRVNFSMSVNDGQTWSLPVVIAKTPSSSNKLRMQSFVPSVEVGSDHRVYVTYYDFRFDTKTNGEATDYWAISCAASCHVATSWGNEQRLTTASFNMLNAPVARGHFLGDYMGLARQGTGMQAVFGIATATSPVNKSEMVSVHISPP
jgi:hypothetical protein